MHGRAASLGDAYVHAVRTARFDPKLHGSAQILSWLGDVRAGDEQALFCPADDIAPPETPDERRVFHPRGRDELTRARGLGSHAVRDFEKFPIAELCGPHAILCDRQGDHGRTTQHKGWIVIVFDHGDVKRVSCEELGLRPGDPIVVGPDSPCPLLRVFERP